MLIANLCDVLYFVGFHFIEKTRGWYHNQIRRPQSTVKRSFGISTVGSQGVDGSNKHNTDDDSAWPSSLIGKNISYEVPLKKKKSVGINIRKVIRKVTVKMAGKQVTKSISVETEEEDNTIKLLRGVNVHFRRGRMCCLMGTSGAGKVRVILYRLNQGFCDIILDYFPLLKHILYLHRQLCLMSSLDIKRVEQLAEKL